jgi:hypothetical protein
MGEHVAVASSVMLSQTRSHFFTRRSLQSNDLQRWVLSRAAIFEPRCFVQFVASETAIFALTPAPQ